MNVMEWIKQPWAWYVAGPLIGLMVPALLLLGNKTFGISSSLRHICAACFPGNISFFRYDWKKEIWNLFFAAGIIAGAAIAFTLLSNDQPMKVNPELVNDLQQYGINNYNGIVPPDLFNWQALLTARGLILIVAGGFLVGFGTRYAGGCTSGHSIMGLSNLQWPSLVATCCFMIGGFITAHLVLPVILKL
jgi:uncharacterized membrane protein YedE/YeeE